MEKVPASGVVTAVEGSESPLPPQVQQALGSSSGQRGRACSRSASVSGSGSCTS
jgi:hypothetical protein